ncbi:MAG: DNA polymerase III subunit gamma/tau [Candidatus Levyibacteriota bacterium]
MVFYRKYRPQTIEQLDSTAVRDMLHSVLQKEVPHALLFTGPKGLGKTSTARILAKAVNCVKRGKNLEPCNTCEQCGAITNGTSLDILEIDAASNRGIDEIRELKEKIRLAPVSAKKKVYIIDEVHMLTTEAFNALLKTLEEPPDHAMFILCTTEPQKIPSTILSRCFHISFKPATEEELIRSFKRIVKGENIAITEKALSIVAHMADKGFRDGVKILEEVNLLANNKEITEEFIESSFKTKSVAVSVLGLVVLLQQRKIKESLLAIKAITDDGTDIKYYTNFLINTLHETLLAKLGVTENKNLADTDKFTVDEIKFLMPLLTKAYGEMKYAVVPQLPLELAVLEWCEMSEEQEGESASAQPVSQVNVSVTGDGVSVSSLRKQIGTMKKLKALYGEPKKEKQIEEVEITTSTVALEHTTNDGVETKEWMDHFWNNLIVEMKKYNHTVAGVLRGCTIKSYSDQQMIIQTSYKFHKERLDDMKNREALLKVSKLLTGKDIEITIELKK